VKAGRRRLVAVAAAMLLAGLLAMLWRLWGPEMRAFFDWALGRGGSPVLFLVLFAALPLLGFPVTAFLVLLGARFGITEGLLIMGAGMAIHLLAAFWVAHSFLHGPMMRLLQWMNYRLPQVPEERVAWFSLIFMAVPGLSYCLKNYILPLAGVPLRWFFLSGFFIQGAMGIPFVVAGDAMAAESLLLLVGVFGVLLVGYAVVWRLRKRNGNLLPPG
jgi:uncharacterized membrane protein YdjX (TVP38/TMEM64 family)